MRTVDVRVRLPWILRLLWRFPIVVISPYSLFDEQTNGESNEKALA